MESHEVKLVDNPFFKTLFFVKVCVMCSVVCGFRWVTSLTMAHRSFLNLLDGLEGYARDLLSRVSRDYDLKEQELLDRYVLADFGGPPESMSPTSLSKYRAAQPSPVARATVPAGRRGRKPAPGLDSLDLSRPQTESDLAGLTIPSLKELCKLKGLKVTGSRPDLISRFMSWQSDPDQADLKPKRGGRKKQRESTPETAHNHPLDGEHHRDCPECDAHGNPLTGKIQDFEVAPPVGDKALDDLIASMESMDVSQAPQPPPRFPRFPRCPRLPRLPSPPQFRSLPRRPHPRFRSLPWLSPHLSRTPCVPSLLPSLTRMMMRKRRSFQATTVPTTSPVMMIWS